MVTYGTKALIDQSVSTLRAVCPQLHLTIVDGSEDFACASFVRTLAGPLCTVHSLGSNIGHGRGLNYAILRSVTSWVLCIDSDVHFIADPLPAMLALTTPETYAVGPLVLMGRDGLRRNPVRDVPYVEPWLMLVRRAAYDRWPAFVHHGSPLYKTMNAINDAGESALRLQPFTAVDAYAVHLWGGTRKFNTAHGKPETPMLWDR